MRLLLDTHIVVWAALDPAALTTGECRFMEQADGPSVLSAVAVWELRLKWQRLTITGGGKEPVDPAGVVAFAAAMGWASLPLGAAAGAGAGGGVAAVDP